MFVAGRWKKHNEPVFETSFTIRIKKSYNSVLATPTDSKWTLKIMASCFRFRHAKRTFYSWIFVSIFSWSLIVTKGHKKSSHLLLHRFLNERSVANARSFEKGCWCIKNVFISTTVCEGNVFMLIYKFHLGALSTVKTKFFFLLFISLYYAYSLYHSLNKLSNYLEIPCVFEQLKWII